MKLEPEYKTPTNPGASITMNLQSLVVVLLRLMALDLLLRKTIAAAFTQLQGVVRHPLLIIATAMLVAVIALVAIAIWFLATPIARLVTRGISCDISLGSLTLAHCYSVTFLGVGLYFAGSYLASVLEWGHYLVVTSMSDSADAWEGFNVYELLQTVITFIVGVVFLVLGRRWGAALARGHAREAVQASHYDEIKEELQ
jgi:hypothetical protein